MRTYELRLATGRTVVWPGSDWESAARDYLRHDPGALIVSWRLVQLDAVRVSA